MSTPTGRYPPRWVPPFHEFPRYGGRLTGHTRQFTAAVREMEELHTREIECWRMFGLTVTQVQDETLVENLQRRAAAPRPTAIPPGPLG